MHFVELGLLNLDQDVNKYLKTWKLPDNEFTKQQKVTLRLLLNHAAGLNVVESFSWMPGSKPTLAQVMNGESPALNQPARIEYVPGRGGAYSNLGYILIQMILEDQLSKSFEQIARETVFKPVGMLSSTFIYPLTGEQQSKEAMPHDGNGKSCKAIMHPTAFAQGGLMTTSDDLALFANELMLAYQGRSNKIIGQSTVQMMLTPFMELSPEIFGFPAAAGTGVMIQGTGSDFAFFHSGENFPGSTCWLFAIPRLGKAAVIMTNGNNGTALTHEILSKIRAEYKWPVIETPAHPRPKISVVMLAAIEQNGVDSSIRLYQQIKADSSNTYLITENELNIVGYDLLNRNRIDEAIKIFELIIDEYPNSWNAYDSYGEAYMKKGDKVKAILNYKKSIKLNPRNNAGKKMIKLMETALTENEKLFGLAQYWSEAKYNFVYFDQVPALDWDSLYKAYIPQVVRTKSDYQYFRVMQKFAANLHDGHSLVMMPAFIVNQLDKPGIIVKEFEKKMYVVNTDISLKETIPLGAEIVEVNGIAISQYLADSVFPYISASAEPARWDQAAENLLVGFNKTKVSITVTYKENPPRKVSLIRNSKNADWVSPISTPNFLEYKMLDDNIVYIALNSFFADSSQVLAEFNKLVPIIKESNGCILDVRQNIGGDSWLGLSILAYFTENNFIEMPSKTRKHVGDYKAKGAYDLYLKGSSTYFDYATNNAWLDENSFTIQNNNKENIKVPLVVLTANETYSAGEDFVVYAKQLGKRLKIVGEPTSGSSGQVLMFLLPGQALAGICAKRVCFPDGTTFVGTGVTPDISIKPTLEQYLKGQDVILEKAVNLFK